MYATFKTTENCQNKRKKMMSKNDAKKEENEKWLLKKEERKEKSETLTLQAHNDRKQTSQRQRTK